MEPTFWQIIGARMMEEITTREAAAFAFSGTIPSYFIPVVVEPEVAPKAMLFKTAGITILRTCGLGLKMVSRVDSLILDKLNLSHGIVSRVMLYGAISYLTYKYCGVFRVAINFAKRVLIGPYSKMVSKFRAWKGWIKTEDVTHRVTDSSKRTLVLESMRTGSDEFPCIPNKYQATVGCIVDDVFQAVGGAHREYDYLVMPTHVIAAALTLSNKDTISIKGNQGILEVGYVSFEDIDTDISAAKLTEKEWSTVGLSKVSIEHEIDETIGERVSIQGISNKGTIGNLTHANDFGMVHYSGTTINGYSGGLYMKGSKTCGMHTCGGKINAGYSASYISMRLRDAYPDKSTEDDEEAKKRKGYSDSETWFEQQMQGKNAKHVRFDRTEEGRARLRIRGRYVSIKEDTLIKVCGNNWVETLGKDRFINPQHYDTYHQRQNESVSPAIARIVKDSVSTVNLIAADVAPQVFQIAPGVSSQKVAGVQSPPQGSVTKTHPSSNASSANAQQIIGDNSTVPLSKKQVNVLKMLARSQHKGKTISGLLLEATQN